MAIIYQIVGQLNGLYPVDTRVDLLDLLNSHIAFDVLAYGADPTGAGYSDDAFRDIVEEAGTLKYGGYGSIDAKPQINAQQVAGTIIIPPGEYKFREQHLYRSWLRYQGAGEDSTVLDFSEAGAVSALAPDRDNGFFGIRTSGVHFRDFMLVGDQAKTQSGVNEHGILLEDVSRSSIKRVAIRCFQDAVHARVNTGGSYYNEFDFNGVYNYRNLFIGEGCAVNTIAGGEYVVRADQFNHADYQIYVEKNDLIMTNGSLEGTGNKLVAHVFSGDGDVSIAARTEGATVLAIPGNGFNGQCHLRLSGTANDGEGIIKILDIDGINPDEGNTSFGGSIDIGIPDGVPLRDKLTDILTGPLQASGNDGWNHVNPTHAHISWVKGRADTFLSRGGIKMTKAGAAISYLSQNFSWRGANTYVYAVVKASADAGFFVSVAGLTGYPGNFKTANRIIDYGSNRYLYALNISDYAATDLTATLQVGLTAASPIGSEFTVMELGINTGGFPKFPTDEGRDILVAEAPTAGVVRRGDRFWIRDASSGAAPGVVGTDDNDTTIATGAVATDTKIYLAAITGIASGDIFGVVQDDGTQHWSTVDTVGSDGGGDFVTIIDALTEDAAIGNDVITFETAAMAALA